MYETKDGGHSCKRCKETSETCYSWAKRGVGCYNGRGKVVGEFVCDKIIEAPTSFISPDTVNIAIRSRLTEKDLVEYGKCKTIYGLHISDLKIYDKPRELSEFIAGEKKHCVSYFGGNCARSTTADIIRCKNLICERKEITRPPQSWCYVEEL